MTLNGKLVVVAGASPNNGLDDEIGGAYAKRFVSDGYEVVGFRRSHSETTYTPGIESYLHCDFLDPRSVHNLLAQLRLRERKDITYIHAAGTYGEALPGVDADDLTQRLIQYNAESLDLLVTSLEKQGLQNPLSVVAFGMSGPKYGIHELKPFAKSNLETEKILKHAAIDGHKSLYIRTGKVKTAGELRFRPKGHEWQMLLPSQFVDNTYDFIGLSNYNEARLFVEWPAYERAQYADEYLLRTMQEQGYESSFVPGRMQKKPDERYVRIESPLGNIYRKKLPK